MLFTFLIIKSNVKFVERAILVSAIALIINDFSSTIKRKLLRHNIKIFYLIDFKKLIYLNSIDVNEDTSLNAFIKISRIF